MDVVTVPRLRGSHALAGMAAVVVCGLIAVLGSEPVAARRAQAGLERPDIVMVVLDDVVAGSMPRLLARLPSMRERFVETGIRFTSAIGETPMCCPGRAGLLTGQHTHNHGVFRNNASRFDPTVTLATVLDDRGYYTALAGKYFNRMFGLKDKTPPGWDHIAGFSGGYYEYLMWVDGVAEGHHSLESDHSVDVSTGHAVDFIEQAPADQPLFLWYSPYAVHGEDGWYPKPAPRHIDDPRCDGVANWKPPNYAESDLSDKPAWIRARGPMGVFPTGWPMEPMCDTLLSVDEGFAAIEDALAPRGRLDDTIWVLVADNGMTYGQHSLTGKLVPYATPIPLYVSWPAGRGETQRTEDLLVSNIDIAPTLAALAGATMPDADGLDWSPLLRDQPVDLGRGEVLESLPATLASQRDLPTWWGIRTADKRWHYIEWSTGERELYDLTSDPWELTSRDRDSAYARYIPGLSARLHALMPDG